MSSIFIFSVKSQNQLIMKLKYLVISIFSLLISCSSQIDSTTYSDFQKKGNDISGKAQSTLLKNVGMAMQKGGPQYAVEFCNLEASSIIDSLNGISNSIISRVSIKNRNPKAGLNSELEKQLWEVFKKGNVTDTIVRTNSKLVFYKPIKIGLPACLKCHGNLESDINDVTHQKLKVLYPTDLATGYKLEDFRGLWKIEFERE